MPRLGRNEEVISVGDLVKILRAGDWIIQVGRVMQAHETRKVHLDIAYVAEGQLFLDLHSSGEEGRRVTEAYPLESLMVIRRGPKLNPIYTLRGNVATTVSDGRGGRRAKTKGLALAAFQRKKSTKHGQQHGHALAKLGLKPATNVKPFGRSRQRRASVIRSAA